MPISTLRIPARLVSVLALSWALTSCGTNIRPIICDAPASSVGTCTCGSGTSACPATPGPRFLYAFGVTGQIQAFAIDQNSGVLTAIGSVPIPYSISDGLTSVNSQFLFASSRSQSQLYGFSIDQTTGVLTALKGSPFSTGTLTAPSALLSPTNSSFLYAADIAQVDAFSISAAGVPSEITGSPFVSGSSVSLATDPSGEFLYAPDAGFPGSVSAFTIGSTGGLTVVPNSPFAIPGQTDGSPDGIADTGSYVYTTLSLTDQIAGFSIVSGTGALTPVPNSPFASGNNPAAIVFANDTPNEFIYVLNQGMSDDDGSISGYSIESTGALTPLSGFPIPIVGFSMAVDSFYSLSQYLYVASSTGIQGFTINSTSGALTPLSGSPFAASGATLLTVVQIPPP
jgi:6-phosphogluconolactonase